MVNVGNRRKRLIRRIKDQRYLLLMLLPGLIYYIVLRWGPMFGMVIAFQRFNASSGILGSPWVGLKNFQDFFNSPFALRVVRNTFSLCLLQLVFSFPLPIIFSLLLNELSSDRFKKTVQVVSYLPHFISVVIMMGLLKQLLSPTSGIVNKIIVDLGGTPINFFMEKGWFRPLYILSGIWQELGWNAILYLSAISNVDPQLYEAAKIDGSGRFGCMWHVTLPGILPTVVIVFLLNLGSMLNIGYEKVLLMYTPATYEVADVISTFVYRSGLSQANYSFGSAVDLMNAIVSLSLVSASNWLSRKLTETSLW